MQSREEFADIQKQLKAITEECVIRGIPVFWCAAVLNGKRIEYMMDGVTPASLGLSIEHDKIPKLINLVREPGE